MTVVDSLSWTDANQRALTVALADLRASLVRRVEGSGDLAPPAQGAGASGEGESPAALERLCSIFGLSRFERAVLLLCAGMELDASFADLCAAAQGDPARGYPSFSLALSALEQAHWSALAPDAPLRHWRLIEVQVGPGMLLTTSPLRIDERILHFLVGVQHLDDRLVGLVEPAPDSAPLDLVSSHRALAQRIVEIWKHSAGPPPAVQLCGPDTAEKRSIAAAACADLGVDLWVLDADLVPASGSELEGLARLWQREAALASRALYIDTERSDGADSQQKGAIARLVERLGCAVFLGTRDRWRSLQHRAVTLEISRPTAVEQRILWETLVGESASRLNGHLDVLASQYNLTPSGIRAAVQQARLAGAEGDALAEQLWDAGRSQAQPRLSDLARRIEPVAAWEDLVLPAAAMQSLRDAAAQVAHRGTVYGEWGFGAVCARGLGISALFTGASGTGKTMAAEVLAHALRLDLYRIDLSSVVSKYIGETEKNLRRIFDAAEDGGAILFFDEADALFGKRSEVKDSHDRYANIEINYLLQRMEQYQGLAVLATNRKGDLDPAFLRRLRFVIPFPFPDAAHRAEIWRRVFPPLTPVEDLDWHRLAILEIAGGSIRNIAVTAAFLAAASGEPVRMTHLREAARTEYAKLEKPLAEHEIGGWQ